MNTDDQRGWPWHVPKDIQLVAHVDDMVSHDLCRAGRNRAKASPRRCPPERGTAGSVGGVGMIIALQEWPSGLAVAMR